MAVSEVPADEVELLVDARAVIGEGPVWSADEQALYWVDILSNVVHRYDPASGRDETVDVSQPVGAVGLGRDGLVLALRDGFGWLDRRTGRTELRAPVEADDPSTRMNEGKPDAAGRFWAGTMAFDATPRAGAFYRLDPDWTVTRQFGDVTISNGLDWSLDGRTMYYVDSPTQAVDAFDFDPLTGGIAARRHLFEIPRAAGLPDGMTVDADGFLWVALHGTGVIHRYAATGQLDRVLRVPARRVTSCAFGGPDLTDLYITSASEGLSAEEWRAQPHAGGLFRYRAGVRGRLPNRFAG
jgi:sugar lactone lactonase YvrE